MKSKSKNEEAMLTNISADIEKLKLVGKSPNYIIIHENDTMTLMREMVKAKLLPDIWKNDILKIEGIKIIRTRDIDEGEFDVVG